MTRELQEKNLILDDRVEEYDGTTAVVRTEGMTPRQVEFMRWQADRFMKLRHMQSILFHEPLFLLRNAHRMFGHTYRGCTLKTLLGIEDEHRAFERFREIRNQERAYI